MKKYFLDRLREPSTWSGIGVLATLAGMPPGAFELAQQVVIGLAGLYAVFAREKASV